MNTPILYSNSLPIPLQATIAEGIRDAYTTFPDGIDTHGKLAQFYDEYISTLHLHQNKTAIDAILSGNLNGKSISPTEHAIGLFYLSNTPHLPEFIFRSSPKNQDYASYRRWITEQYPETRISYSNKAQIWAIRNTLKTTLPQILGKRKTSKNREDYFVGMITLIELSRLEKMGIAHLEEVGIEGYTDDISDLIARLTHDMETLYHDDVSRVDSIISTYRNSVEKIFEKDGVSDATRKILGNIMGTKVHNIKIDAGGVALKKFLER